MNDYTVKNWIENCLDEIRKLREEKQELLEAKGEIIMKEYKSREYCRDIKCSIQRSLDNDEISENDKKIIKKESCHLCDAYKFHQWLKENNYRIVRKENKNGY